MAAQCIMHGTAFVLRNLVRSSPRAAAGWLGTGLGRAVGWVQSRGSSSSLLVGWAVASFIRYQLQADIAQRS